ncbi:hypothetical protein C8N35_10377 [Breoghania corrubedonensis]|uniref:Uncharacterized protein n=1 Tax=Breoghania corrubedonensis TaxID=665038 RepID=A0A2T5VAW6_9HYPH|nr:hypothetical protein [Breoghania corrubedonensis]PTW60897.1 hypothetical protein C8N35_10377 [Breoghania corrubedonensis]
MLGATTRIVTIFTMIILPYSAFSYPIFNISRSAEAAIESAEASKLIIESIQNIMRTFLLAESGELDPTSPIFNGINKRLQSSRSIIDNILEKKLAPAINLDALELSERTILSNFLEGRDLSIEAIESDPSLLISAYSEEIKKLEVSISTAQALEKPSENGLDSTASEIGIIIGDLISIGGIISKVFA